MRCEHARSSSSSCSLFTKLYLYCAQSIPQGSYLKKKSVSEGSFIRGESVKEEVKSLIIIIHCKVHWVKF